MSFRVWTGRLFSRGKSRHRLSQPSEEKKMSAILTRSSRPRLPPSRRPASAAPSHARSRTTSRTLITSLTSARCRGLLAAHCQTQTLKGDWEWGRLRVPLREMMMMMMMRGEDSSVCVSVFTTGWKLAGPSVEPRISVARCADAWRPAAAFRRGGSRDNNRL